MGWIAANLESGTRKELGELNQDRARLNVNKLAL